VISMYVVSQTGGGVEVLMMVCWKVYPQEIYKKLAAGTCPVERDAVLDFFEVSIKNV
jgi:hypothetical protein